MDTSTSNILNASMSAAAGPSTITRRPGPNALGAGGSNTGSVDSFDYSQMDGLSDSALVAALDEIFNHLHGALFRAIVTYDRATAITHETPPLLSIKEFFLPSYSRVVRKIRSVQVLPHGGRQFDVLESIFST